MPQERVRVGVKRHKEGNFLQCKACRVLRGFQDAQHYNLQVDAPTSTRPGFRLQCQAAAIHGHDVGHIELRISFLQGEIFDDEGEEGDDDEDDEVA